MRIRLRLLAIFLPGLALSGVAAERIDYSPEDLDLTSTHGGDLVEWDHPVYPPELKAAGVNGDYYVRYIVDEKGAITSLEGVRGDLAGVAADDVAIEVVGDDQGKLGVGAGERTLERASLQHAAQQVDVAADEPVSIVVDRPHVGGGTELDPGGLTGDTIVTADQAAKPFG